MLPDRYHLHGTRTANTYRLFQNQVMGADYFIGKLIINFGRINIFFCGTLYGGYVIPFP